MPASILFVDYTIQSCFQSCEALKTFIQLEWWNYKKVQNESDKEKLIMYFRHVQMQQGCIIELTYDYSVWH